VGWLLEWRGGGFAFALLGGLGVIVVFFFFFFFSDRAGGGGPAGGGPPPAKMVTQAERNWFGGKNPSLGGPI